MTTGEIVRKLRIEKGYTQNELAIMLGLTLSTLQKYESGAIQNLKIDTLRELCHIFEVPPIAFVFPTIDDKLRDVLAEWLLAEYTVLNKMGRKKVINYINDLQKIDEYLK